MSKQAFVALVTCFNEDETINYEATRAQVRRQVAAGNNIMCAGTNGDFTALTHAEKIRLTEEVVDEVAGRAKVIVNAGMPATFETLQLAKAFDRIGVDGIAVITPFFIACTQDGLIRHFSTVADAVETPVYLYDIPARTQNHIEPETARKLATHGNIAGIKDSGGAQQTLEAYLQVAKEMPGFEVYSGPDHLVLWSLQNGAAGCISGLGNALPDVLAGILNAFNAGDITEAERQQAIYADFRTDLYALGFAPAMVKRSLYLQDPSVGASRQPALLPDKEQDEKILEILRRY
ncbi:dihydrodipicolinate synthase family protein [Agrobacterium tumefaciens]|uniref:Dihydrodipicolinate synthase n=2 Tax=Agrobacterium TaxID=357 RepID=A0A2L2LHX2_AGRTU|nr:dihydrodipicolinate synthase family protein [Agrobacterium tumefaciens]AVH43896.1 dihydrodipicolinate synthase [Agrobacterium tumefaciens]NSY97832.1 dihydrodipicolinate synthase family protein [Agrobacterium tumefaciens]NSZ01100.1 dihydrodipicolinate synthase family protein [Agrobacterium tumefaciens]NSZ37380.1 dihydrodipicolinate synthase family protein [Agrobacterium tumefaciens]NTB24639.1 dihydrodipicolinate synthase family protein [Agrobacterium tumefaciens]